MFLDHKRSEWYLNFKIYANKKSPHHTTEAVESLAKQLEMGQIRDYPSPNILAPKKDEAPGAYLRLF